MHHINNNILATFGIMLMLISISGQYIIHDKANEIEKMQSPSKITGKAIGTVSLVIMRPFTEIDFRGILDDNNETIILIWENLSQDNVSIYMTNNLSAGFDYGNPNITGITILNWSDPTANTVSERYYRIGISNMGIFNLSENIVGKYDINLTTVNGRWNYISLPLVPYNNSRSEILKGISGSYDWIYEYIPSGGNYSYRFDTFSTGNIHNLDANKCYIVQATNDITFTVVGDDNSAIDEELITNNGRWNYVGWINEITARNIATGSIAGDFDWIYEYTPEGGNYSFWFDTFSTGNINTFNPSKCYIIQATADTNLTYTK